MNQVRVRYNDTDRMSFVYHGNYAMYFEVSRLEMLRSRGLTYKKMEEEGGVMLPVSDLHIKYIHPAFYDDLLDVEVTLLEKPSVRVRFGYRVTNQDGVLICTGEVVLACVDGHPVAVLEDSMLALAFHPELTRDLRFHAWLARRAAARARH